MTCSFCGMSDDRVGSYELHYRRHQLEELQRIRKALQGITDILDERLAAPINEQRLAKLEEIHENVLPQHSSREKRPEA